MTFQMMRLLVNVCMCDQCVIFWVQKVLFLPKVVLNISASSNNVMLTFYSIKNANTSKNSSSSNKLSSSNMRLILLILTSMS